MKSSIRTISCCLFVSGVLLVPALSTGQGCNVLESEFSEPPVGVDAIVLTIYGGRRAGRTLSSIDDSGRVVFLSNDQRPSEAMVGLVDAILFDELVMGATRAVESLRSRPNPSTLQELLEIVQGGRIEGLCRSHSDGVDKDVTLYIGGEKTHYACVTGELDVFSRHLLGVVSEAIAKSGQRLCP